jgi:hypothetical protein
MGTVVAALGAFSPAAAFAAGETYFASPNADPGNACTEASPCRMAEALGKVEDGDAVKLEGGFYTLPIGGISIAKQIDFGAATTARPVLESSIAGGGIMVTDKANATLHDLYLSGEGTLRLESGSADRVFVDYTGSKDPISEQAACELNVGTILRDSVCWAREGGEQTEANGIEALVEGEGKTGTVTLRNVTAIADDAGGQGLHALGANGARFTVDGSGVLARASHGADVGALLFGGSNPEARVNLTHSNYATRVDELPYAPVTPPGTDGNQIAAPVFIDAAGGDFHEAETSPTIDGGLADSLTGPFDFDGHLRVQAGCLTGPSVPDIGAFERTATASCPPPPPPPPPVIEPPKPKFRIVKVTAHGAGGSIQVETPGPGTLTLTGLGIKLITREAPSAQIVTMPIRPWAITKVRLNRSGKTKVRLNLTFTPTSGASHQKSRGLLLKKG